MFCKVAKSIYICISKQVKSQFSTSLPYGWIVEKSIIAEQRQSAG